MNSLWNFFYMVFRDPNLSLPLLFDLIFGFLFCILVSKKILRFFAWIFIPILVATGDVWYHVHKFANDREVQEDWVIFGSLFVFGFGLCAYAGGIMLAHFLKREIKNH